MHDAKGKDMKMTNDAVMSELKSDSPLNRARQKFSSAAARIEQAGQQRKPPSPVDIRRMEFEAVREIVEALGLQMPTSN